MRNFRNATAREGSPYYVESFTAAQAQRRPQGVKKGPRIDSRGPFQRVCDDCGAHGQSSVEDHSMLWWSYPDALGTDSLMRMIARGPTHKIVGCGLCGSHKLKGILFADFLI